MSFLPNRFYFDDLLDDFVKDTKEFGTMKCDIYEKDDCYHVEMDIPGFDKKDIMLNCEEGYLTIEATKEHNNEDNSKNYLRRERIYGKVKRQFYVGNVDSENIKAQFNNGVLNVTLPIKKLEDNKKRIEIE